MEQKDVLEAFTAETLRRERDRRFRERQRIADEFDDAANVLQLNKGFGQVVSHLREEAKRWRL